MPARSPEHRALIARIANQTRLAKTRDTAELTVAARKGLRAKFEREADPTGALPPDERARRADHLHRAHMLRMSLRAAQARQARRSRVA